MKYISSKIERGKKLEEILSSQNKILLRNLWYFIQILMEVKRLRSSVRISNNAHIFPSNRFKFLRIRISIIYVSHYI